MGANLALQALEKGMHVVGFDLKKAPDEMLRAGLVQIGTPDGFREKLSPQRAVFIYVPAGPIVDRIIGDLVPHLEKGDVVIDGGTPTGETPSAGTKDSLKKESTSSTWEQVAALKGHATALALWLVAKRDLWRGLSRCL